MIIGLKKLALIDDIYKKKSGGDLKYAGGEDKNQKEFRTEYKGVLLQKETKNMRWWIVTEMVVMIREHCLII